MADRYTKIRARQFLNFDLRPEDVKAVNSPQDIFLLGYNAPSALFEWFPYKIYDYAYSEGASSTTSTSYIVKTTLNFTAPIKGKYVVYFNAEILARNSGWWSTTARARLLFARETDTGYKQYGLYVTDYRGWRNVSGFKMIDLEEGEQAVFKILYSSGNWSTTARVRRARIYVELAEIVR